MCAASPKFSGLFFDDDLSFVSLPSVTVSFDIHLFFRWLTWSWGVGFVILLLTFILSFKISISGFKVFSFVVLALALLPN